MISGNYIRKEALAIGATNYIEKLCSGDELFRILDKYLINV